MSDVKIQRSCDELGTCQRRKPACNGCTAHAYNFAPGVIQRLSPSKASRTKRLMLKLGNALIILAAASLSWGYVATKAGWL